MSKTILLVEDEADTREKLTHLLESRGYGVHAVGNGLEALQALQDGPAPTLILLDSTLAIRKRGEFRKGQRLDPILERIPVVVFADEGEDARSAEQLGDVGHLCNPVRVEDLFATIERFAVSRRPEVLLVEDDPMVLRCLDEILRHYGFVVHKAGSGTEAVQIYTQHGESIDAVLLDVQMPEMDGPQTFALLKNVNPAVRVVFMSGNTGHYSTEDLLDMGAAGFLQKPFRGAVELVRTLRSLALERPGG